jgi:uncharacterized membrane protein
MFKKSIALCVGFSIICIGMAGYAQEKSPNRIVFERLIAQIDLSSWIPENFIVSPDSKRVAYEAQVGNNWFVVVDGKEEKQYDGIVTIGEGRIIFDSADSIHYLALKGNKIYLVEEAVK